MSKGEQRKHIKELIRLFSAKQLQDLSTDVLARIEKHPLFCSANIILLYYSLPDEVHTHSLIEKWCQKKTILLPKVCGHILTLHQYLDKSCVKEGFMKIKEPITEQFHDTCSIDLAIIPGLAFDRQGFRLGRGKGFYDKLLCQPYFANVYKIGIAFPFQILPHVCHEAHDIRMNEVIW